MIDTSEALPEVDHPELNNRARDIESIDIIFISPGDLSKVAPEMDDALGFANFVTLESDPFEDDADHPRHMRCFIVFDPEAVGARIMEEAELDGSTDHLLEYEISEAATISHEMAHIIMFLKNSGSRSPFLIDSLHTSGALNNDLGDFISGYGIRDVEIDGETIEAEDALHATEILEEWCETAGRKWAADAIIRIGSFYLAAGIDPGAIAETAIANRNGPQISG